VWIGATVGVFLLLSACHFRDHRLNFILISIDTLRADHLGAYGYPRPTSPSLDRLAAESILFESVISQAPWTLPSHVTMLTSLYPSTHHATVDATAMDRSIPTLATLLRAEGFATAAFIDHVFVSSIYGFDRGFDRFDEQGGGAARIPQRALEWIGKQAGRPFFLFVHLYDPHCPYSPPAGYGELFRSRESRLFDLKGKCGNSHLNQMGLTPGQVAHIIDQYDGEIAHLDARLGVFFAGLRDAAVWEKTLLMVTSDHGEEFLEHGQIGHERTVYDEVLRVPWIVRVPGRRPGRVEPTVRLIDLPPTALDLLGVDVPPQFQGASLVPLLNRGGGKVPDAYAELDRHVRKRSLHSGGLHLVRTDPRGTAGADVTGGEGPPPSFELYALDRDPGETENLFDSDRMKRVRPLTVGSLEEFERIADAAGRGYRPGDLEFLDEEQRRELEERLRALGYLP
jgi:arylsulfatase A-like enzyme